MAGDWIKMRADLHTHPKVVRIASALNADRLRTVGGLHAVWCLFDVHSDDGRLDGYTPEAIDDLIGWSGFSNAMQAVQWLEIEGGYATLPRFDEHNGKSAKRRAQEAERKRREREEEAEEAGRKASASDADKKRTREEKRREDVSLPKGNGAQADESASTPDACPHQEIIALFHECLPSARQVREWTPARAQALRARWREKTQRQDLDWWRSFFTYVGKSDFLMGRTSGLGRKPFELSLDWLVKAENMAKVIEGAYEGGGQ